MNYETLLFEIEDKIGLLTLNRPEKLNAHSRQMRQELLQFWRERQNDEAQVPGHDCYGSGKGLLRRR